MKNWQLIVLLGVLLQSCGSEESTVVSEKVKEAKMEIGLTKAQITNAGIKTDLLHKELIGLTIYANGTIEVPPQNKTVISAQFGGFIKSLEVLDGMEVKQGQTLITIEHPELIQLQQDYLEVVGNLEYLKAEMDRQQALLDKEAGSAKNYQLAKSQYNASMAKKSGLKAKLDMSGVNISKLQSGDIQRSVSIKAPFNGVVTKVNVNVGSYADPVDHLLEIIDLKHSHAEVIVFEKDVKHLQIGQKVKLNFANEKRSLDAKIFLVGKEIAKDRTVKVHCHLDKENKDIAPGSYFKASIFTGESEEYCIPNEAIVEINGNTMVFVPLREQNGLTYYKPVPVRVISASKTISAIEVEKSGFSVTDRIVISGAYDIMSAMLVSDEE